MRENRAAREGGEERRGIQASLAAWHTLHACVLSSPNRRMNTNAVSFLASSLGGNPSTMLAIIFVAIVVW